MKTINKELLKQMNGCEVKSSKYEGVVGIEGNEVIQLGEVVDYLNTDEKVREIWREYCEDEGINEETEMWKEKFEKEERNIRALGNELNNLGVR